MKALVKEYLIEDYGRYLKYTCIKENARNIDMPSLFIQALDDPVGCQDEIDLTNIFQNQNIINLFYERGGHGQHFSNWGFKRHSYEIMKEFFLIFDKKK